MSNPMGENILSQHRVREISEMVKTSDNTLLFNVEILKDKVAGVTFKNLLICGFTAWAHDN